MTKDWKLNISIKNDLTQEKENNEVKKVTWHPFTKRLIDEYGEYPEVLTELYYNMNFISWANSAVPIYTLRKELCDLLINHPKNEVHSWAIELSNYYENEIKKARIEDEERRLF